MAEVVLFNHIHKTAGSTMKHVLWRNFGSARVAFLMSDHGAGLPELRRRLGDPARTPGAVVAHTGYGLHERLPIEHDYRQFTMLRDPVDRTVSAFFFVRDELGAEIDLDEFLTEMPLESLNSQTAALAGLHADHQIDGRALARADFDAELLERAKHNLASHEVVGLTQRFDESLVLLREAYGWPLHRTLYVRANVGVGRQRGRLSPAELGRVAANNELDLELYAYAVELFEARLTSRAPDHEARARRHRRLNAIYGASYPPARALVTGVRRRGG
jgi:Galactose-3-O-sulfotransferase